MSIRERNRRAREYTARCRRKRIYRAMWKVDAILAVLAIFVTVWAIATPNPKKKEDKPYCAFVLETTAEPESTEDPSLYNYDVFSITGYCACCTPYSHMNQRDGLVLTASGRWVHIGECVAVDPDIIPLGSKVTIGDRTYTAYDTGVTGYVVDVLMEHEAAAVAGVRTEIVVWETPSL